MSMRTDDAIIGDIVAALGACPEVRATDIRVHAMHGNVLLTGVVNTLAEKTTAEELARAVNGVHLIENDLVVSADQEISDLELTRQVQEVLNNAGLPGVGAEVHSGNAFLKGVVPSISVKERAMQIAESVSGVRDIISELEIAAGEPIDDITLANDVVEALSTNLELDTMNLRVRSEDSEVVLEGEVANQNDLGLAIEVAQSVPGVKRVSSHLIVHSYMR